MKKILITLLLGNIITGKITAQLTKPQHIDLNKAASTSVKEVGKDITVQGLKIRNMRAAEILEKLKPTYQSPDNTLETVVDLYNAGFSTSEIVAALKNKYSLSLEECTKVICLSYNKSNKSSLDVSAWPYTLQEDISNAYQSQNKFTISLLKQSGMDSEGIAFLFSRYIYYLINFYEQNDKEKFGNYLKDYLDAGFTPTDISKFLMKIPHFDTMIFREFCKAMKKAGVNAYDVIYPLTKIFNLPDPMTVEIMKYGGFSADEILAAFSRF